MPDIFLGGFNPLLDMVIDFYGTFTPYLSTHFLQTDLLQPLRGLGNIVKGVSSLMISPITFLVNIGRYVTRSVLTNNYDWLIADLKMNFFRTAGGLADGISSIIRGVTQILATPLTYFFRLPLRIYLTKTYMKNFENKIIDEISSNSVDTSSENAPLKNRKFFVSNIEKDLLSPSNMIINIEDENNQDLSGEDTRRIIFPLLEKMLQNTGYIVAFAQPLYNNTYFIINTGNDKEWSDNAIIYITSLIHKSPSIKLTPNLIGKIQTKEFVERPSEQNLTNSTISGKVERGQLETFESTPERKVEEKLAQSSHNFSKNHNDNSIIGVFRNFMSNTFFSSAQEKNYILNMINSNLYCDKTLNVYITDKNDDILDEDSLLKLLPSLKNILKNSDYKIDNNLSTTNTPYLHFSISRIDGKKLTEADDCAVIKLLGNSSWCAIHKGAKKYIEECEFSKTVHF